MKILVSAYACEPGKGSEPGAGWHRVRALACDHDVWVITRANNRAVIEAAIAAEPQPRLRFVWVDLPPWLRALKRGNRGIHLYYYLWQFAALRAARRAHRVVEFDLVQHVTFATALVPAMVAFTGPPFVWGPIGGGVRAPFALAREWGVRGTAAEGARALRRTAARFLDPWLRATWRRADRILLQNPDTARCIPARHRSKVVVAPNGGFDPEEVRPRREGGVGRVRVLLAARLVPWKGARLAVRALAGLPETRLVVVGEGPERRRIERLARALRVEVEFRGWLEQRELFGVFAASDVLLFPSMHDECGFVVVEAMAHGVVPVVLDRGGPPIIVGDAGIAVPVRRRSQVIAGLRDAVRRLAGNPAERARLSERARRRAAVFACDAERDLGADRPLQAVAP